MNRNAVVRYGNGKLVELVLETLRVLAHIPVPDRVYAEVTREQVPVDVIRKVNWVRYHWWQYENEVDQSSTDSER